MITFESVYFKFQSEHRGVRFFRVTPMEKVVQVVRNPGEIKRGRTNTIGVIMIDRMTLFSNYGFGNHLKPCTKKQYQKAFNDVVKMLK